jgi:hypothetical protein
MWGQAPPGQGIIMIFKMCRHGAGMGIRFDPPEQVSIASIRNQWAGDGVGGAVWEEKLKRSLWGRWFEENFARFFGKKDFREIFRDPARSDGTLDAENHDAEEDAAVNKVRPESSPGAAPLAVEAYPERKVGFAGLWGAAGPQHSHITQKYGRDRQLITAASLQRQPDHMVPEIMNNYSKCYQHSGGGNTAKSGAVKAELGREFQSHVCCWPNARGRASGRPARASARSRQWERASSASATRRDSDVWGWPRKVTMIRWNPSQNPSIEFRQLKVIYPPIRIPFARGYLHPRIPKLFGASFRIFLVFSKKMIKSPLPMNKSSR